ncbi:MAG: hypothetical protein ACFB4I_00825 [Cyanophyceae cyanobacterium]
MSDHELSSAVEERFRRLESVVNRVGKAVLATTETVECLAKRIDDLAVQVKHQGHQVQQQSYQICAISDALQNFMTNQSQSREELNQLTETLQNLTAVLTKINGSGS